MIENRAEELIEEKEIDRQIKDSEINNSEETPSACSGDDKKPNTDEEINGEFDDKARKTEEKKSEADDMKTESEEKKSEAEEDALYPLKVATPDLSVVSAVFGQSEEEIEREFKSFKAEKLFSLFDFDLTGISGDEEIKAKAEECKKYGFGSIIVLPQYISVAKKQMGKGADVIGAVSFPYGEEIPYSTVRSAKKTASKGADALLVPVGVSFIKRGEFDKIKKTFKSIIKKTKKRVIAIVECGSITIEEAERTVKALADAGVKEFRSGSGIKRGDELTNLKSMRSALKNGNKVISPVTSNSYLDAMRLLGVADRVSSRYAVYIADEIRERLNLR